MACLLPVGANAQDWKTSSLQDINSGFTPRVTDVGAEATKLIPMTSTSPMIPAGTTSSWGDSSDSGSGHKGSTRRGFITPGDPGDQSEEFPVGEPWVMLVFAACGAALIAARRRRTERG